MQRTLDQITLKDTCSEFPFSWDHVKSNDFYFEDSMRLAHYALCMLQQARRRAQDSTCPLSVSCWPSMRAAGMVIYLFCRVAGEPVRFALVILLHLERNSYVQSLQHLPHLPLCLRAASLLQAREAATIMFVRNLQRTKYQASPFPHA